MMSAETSRLDLTVKQGLQKLIEGNQRFMRGEARCPTVCKETLANLARGQHRYALPMPLPRNSPLSCRNQPVLLRQLLRWQRWSGDM